MTGPSESSTAPARITLIGTTGSGKSHVARQIGAALRCPVFDLDDQHWLPGWQVRPADEFRARIAAIVEAPRWVIAGNYSNVRDLVWRRADAILWLDYGAGLTFNRLLARSVRRARSGEPICNGNVERWAKLFTPDSILVWFFRTYWRNRRRYAALFEQPGEWQGKVMLRHRRPVETEAWLAGLDRPPQ